MSLQDKAEIKRLRKALDELVNGPMLDQHNHDFDRGISSFIGIGTGQVPPALLRRWRAIAVDALVATV
jgi:hypothetical protein